MLAALALCVLGVLGGPGVAGAHLGNLSYSDIDVRADHVLWRLKYAAHLTPGLPPGQSVPPTRAALLELQDGIEQWLGNSVEVASAAGRCKGAVENLIGPDARDDLQVLAVWKCPDKPIASLRIVFHAFEAKLDDWQNLATVRLGGKTYNTVFTPSSTRLFLGEPGAGAAATPAGVTSEDCEVSLTQACADAGSLFVLGLQQMWSGYDHLLFLVAALMIGASLARLATIAASFTLGHSLTLALGALGFVSVPRAALEVALALSIVAVAAENLLRSDGIARRRAVVTFVLGLLHGLGFAAVFADSGRAASALAPSLLAFHGGLEVGQLALLAAAIPAVRALGRVEAAGALQRAPSALIGLVGLGLALVRIAGALRGA